MPTVEQAGGEVVGGGADLEVTDRGGDRTVARHRHQRGQGDVLAAALGDEAGTQAVATEVACWRSRSIDPLREYMRTGD